MEGRKVGNMCRKEINFFWGEGKRFVTPLMRTIFAVQMRKSMFLPPSPPVPPEGATLPRGEWLWHPMI